VPLELSFLGSSEVRLNGRAVNLPTRKAFALLAFIACEPGLHSREKLAAMFWPDNDESGGRTALRKALGFLNTALEVNQDSFLKATRDALGFDHGPNVQSDVLDLETAAKHARTADGADASELRTRLEQVADGLRGEFMAGFALPESTDFEDWLDLRRESLRRDADAVLQRLSSLQANASQVQVALVTARKRVALDALNEAAHRTVIELHLRSGDRAAALEAYRTCQDILEKELGLSPAAETQVLAEQARNGQRAPQPEPNPSGAAIVLKPNTKTITTNVPFVGREREWSMLEDAWNTGMIAYVSGEPGSGKSRLMQEFMRSQGEFVTLENRPGDAGVPYASLARHLRALFKHQPVTLEVWASSELSRILPELGGEPSPIQSEQGKLRFLQAIAHAFQTVIQTRDTITALIYDDAQFTDTSSSEATSFVLEQLEPEDRERLRILYGYRKNELSPELEARVKQSLLVGEGALIELEALDETALVSLLQSSSSSFETNDLTGIAGTLRRFTGGNPLFMLETIKALGETRGAQPWTQQSLEVLQSSGGLPRTLKVKQVIERRLERLSKPAKDLLRVAAVMGQEYTLERAAKVLEADQLVLAEASEELEVSGVIRFKRFTHDLLYETSLGVIPNTAKPLLYSRVLHVFEDEVLPAAVLVDHAYNANNHEGIVRHSFQAYMDARVIWDLPARRRHLERLRHYHLDPDKRAGKLTDEQIFRLYQQLMYTKIWSLDPDGGRGVFNEVLKSDWTKSNPENECCILLFCVTPDLFTPQEQLPFGFRALDLAHQINRDDLIAQAELNLANSISDAQDPKDQAYTDCLVSAIEYAKNALFHSKRFIENDGQVHPLIGNFFSREDLFVMCQHALSWRLRSINAFNDARRYYEKAIELDDSYGKINPSFYRYVFAEFKADLGELKEAEQLGLEAVETVEKWNLIRQYLVYIPLFSVYAQLGQYALVQTTLEMLEKDGMEHHAKRLFRQYEGLIQFYTGDFKAARKTWWTGWAHEKQMPDDSGVFFESAQCATSIQLNDWSHALEYTHLALRVRNYQNLPPIHSCEFWHFETITLIHAGEINTARADIESRESHVTKWPRYLLPHLRSEAVLHRFENHLDTALEKLQQALEIAQTIGLPREIWEITSDIARLLERQGYTNLAHEARSRAVAVRDSLVVNVPEDMRARYLEFTNSQIHATLFLGELPQS
jgi:DNA-binding SARP family transcriptional activator